MTDRFRITLAQLNPVVGDLAGNAAKARAAWEAGRAADADLVALPEMFVTGHPVRDLARKPAFTAAAMETIERLAGECADGPVLAIGGPYAERGQLHNAYWVCQGGRVRARVLKHVLANRGGFDEGRFHDAGPISGPVAVGPLRIGIPIGADAWHEDVAEAQAESGAEILLVPNGSPYHRGKHDVRIAHMVARVVETGLPLVYLNMVGGQDDHVFDGASFVLNPGGALARQMPFCDEEIAHVDFVRTDNGWRAVEGARSRLPDEWEADYRIMVEGLRDYLCKTGLAQVVLGLAGGVDSALVAAIAVDALGPANVRCVAISGPARDDAIDVARLLGCAVYEVDIEGPRRAMEEALAPKFAGSEEMRFRLCGVALNAVSDRFEAMLLSAINKSDLAVLQGDVAGRYNPIRDLYKSRALEACRWRNGNHRAWMKGPCGEVIPAHVIDRGSIAGPRGEDSLPPTKRLDDILEQLIDHEASIAEIVARGHDREMVREVERRVHLGEFIRHQAAPGTCLTSRAFSLDRQYPIVNRWRDPS